MKRSDLEKIDRLEDIAHPDWYCRNCGKPCKTTWIDAGLDPSECRLEEVSRCCGADITDVNPRGEP